MPKMALFDGVISEKCCSVDGGRGICPLFFSPPWGFAIQGKKKCQCLGVMQGGKGVLGAGGID